MIWYVAGANFRHICDGKGVRVCELDGALGGDPSFEVLECGGLHLVVTEVVPVSGSGDNNKNSSCAARCLSEGLRRVWSLVLFVCLLCSLL